MTELGGMHSLNGGTTVGWDEGFRRLVEGSYPDLVA